MWRRGRKTGRAGCVQDGLSATGARKGRGGGRGRRSGERFGVGVKKVRGEEEGEICIYTTQLV